MANILITGVTGSLGRTLCKRLINQKGHRIYGIYNSEEKYAHLKRNLNMENIKCIKCNIANNEFSEEINFLLSKFNIDYVIHSAAMKHVDICEDNPAEAVKTNILASEKLVKNCLLHNIKNLIALSTDKTISPCNIYGYSKLMMQNIVLRNGYSVYQGANFIGSDGSVLKIWLNQMNKEEPLTVTDLNHIRFFNSLDYVSELIIKNIDIKNKILLPEYVYEVSLKDLLEGFMEFYSYYNYKIIGSDPMEKEVEDIQDSIKKRIKADKSLVKEWLATNK